MDSNMRVKNMMMEIRSGKRGSEAHGILGKLRPAEAVYVARGSSKVERHKP
jgi:hypothetical protein